MLEQRLEGMGQHLIRSIANKYVRRCQTVVIGNGRFELVRIGIGIKLQPIRNFSLNRSQHLGARPIGVFVGVEFDEIAELGLLTRHIGCQPMDNLAPVFAQASLSGDIRPNVRVPVAPRRVQVSRLSGLKSVRLAQTP